MYQIEVKIPGDSTTANLIAEKTAAMVIECNGFITVKSDAKPVTLLKDILEVLKGEQ